MAAVLVGGLAALAQGSAGGNGGNGGAAPAPRRPVHVTVNGVAVRLPPGQATVVHALEATGEMPRDGALRAVVSGTALDPYFDRATVLVDGQPVSMDARLSGADRIEVRHGTDRVEDTTTREVALAYPNQDKVGQPGWLAGSEGLAEEVYGVTSGEVVSRRVVREPVAAREIPKPATVSAGTRVFLTFDDGPDPTYTPQVLDVLRAHGVRATFCMVGRYALASPGLVQRIRDEGHALCNHTASHAALDTLSTARVEAEVSGGSDAIASAAGVRPGLIRFPYGRRSAIADEVINRFGLQVLPWTVDPSDYTQPGTATIVSRVNQSARPGGIVLLHDGGGNRSQTVAALPAIIESLRGAGYEFGTP